MKYKGFKSLVILFIVISFFGNWKCNSDPSKPEYKSIKIGNKIWMLENLNVTTYRNGDKINMISDSGNWASDSLGAYCSFNNSEDSANIYGYLYNAYVINDPRQIAPKGWHIPTREDLEDLIKSLTKDSEGVELREAGEKHWRYSSSTIENIGNNKSGFTALPASYRGANGMFSQVENSTIGYGASWWINCDTCLNTYRALYFAIGTGDKLLNSPSDDMHYGRSIRCVKD